MKPTYKLNDIVTLQNEQAVYVPNEKYRNPLREPKHQRELLKKSRGGYWLARRTGSEVCQPNTLGTEAGIYQSFSGLLSVLLRTTISPFQDYPIIPGTFVAAGVTQISKKFPIENPIHFQQVSKLFQTKSQVTCLKHSTQVVSK